MKIFQKKYQLNQQKTLTLRYVVDCDNNVWIISSDIILELELLHILYYFKSTSILIGIDDFFKLLSQSPKFNETEYNEFKNLIQNDFHNSNYDGGDDDDTNNIDR